MPKGSSVADTFEVVGGSSMTGFCYFFYVCSLYVPIFDLTDVVRYVLADIICNKSSAIVYFILPLRVTIMYVSIYIIEQRIQWSHFPDG